MKLCPTRRWVEPVKVAIPALGCLFNWHAAAVDVVWTNAAGGDWNAVANWDPNLLPGAGDNVFIAVSASIALNNDGDCGSLTLGGPAALPVLTGSGTLTLHNLSSWLSGSMLGSGRTLIAPGASLTCTGSVTLNRTLENAGTVISVASDLVGSGAVLTNRLGALFEVRGDMSFTHTLNACRFDNAGTFRKSISLNTNGFSSAFALNNFGNIDVQTGTLLCNGGLTNYGTVTLSAGTTNRLAGGGASSGIFSAPAGALVDFSAGTFTLNSGAQLNGDGLYRVTGSASLTANANLAVRNLDLAATLDGTGTVTLTNVLNWTAGSMLGSGRTLIAPGASLTCTGSVTLNRTLENAGTVISVASDLVGSGAVLTNRLGALFEVRGDMSFTHTLTPCRFDNAGTFRKSISLNTNGFSSAFALNNYGNIDVQTGTLLCNGGLTNYGTVTLSAGTTNRLAGGGASSGIFSAPAGALVDFSAGTFTLTANALNGGGLYRARGTLNCQADVTVSNLDTTAPGGSLDGGGTLTVRSQMNSWGGQWSGAGRTVIAPGATLSLSNQILIIQRALENGGTVLWRSSEIDLLDGVVVTNRPGALFDAQASGQINDFGSGDCQFDNAGTFRKSVTGQTSFGSLLPFNNYGTVDIQLGILAALGGFNSSSGSLLKCALRGTSPGTGYGQLQGDNVNLAGALSVTLTNGFLPTTNNTFTVVTAASRGGSFASFSYPSNQVTMQLSNSPTSVIVRVTSVNVPPPVLFTPALSGTNVLLTWTSFSNFTYRLEYNPNLAPSNWNAIPGDVTASGSNTTKLDPLTPSNRFYRVRVLP